MGSFGMAGRKKNAAAVALGRLGRFERRLKDVSQVDLVEINVEAMMRCTASVVTPTGFLSDGSPVDRGTAILLDKFKFLLWVNGNAHPNSENEAYYMGRFRI